MAALKPKQLAKYVGHLLVARQETPNDWVRISSIRDLQLSVDPTQNLVEVLTDDNGTVYRATTPQTGITCQYLETLNFALVPILLGPTVTLVPGDPVSDHSQVFLAGSWQPSTFTPLEGQNVDGTAPTIASVTASTKGALVEGTDYFLSKANGMWGIFLLTGGGLTTAEDVTVVSSFTPTEENQIIIPSVVTELPRFLSKIEAVDPADPNKKLTMTIDDSSINSAMTFGFVDISRTGDMAGSDMNIVGNLGSNLYIRDQITGLVA